MSLNKFTEIYNRYKTLISNFSYLSILEIISLVFPIFTYPYLIKVLGSELYGSVIYAQALIAYMIVVINFGFNISATKDISIHRDDPVRLSHIVNSIICLKLFIFLILLLPYVCVIWFSDITSYKLLYIFTLGMCINEIFFPVWFFQGVEKMKYITIITFISRLMFVFLIFALINKPDDYLYIPLIYTCSGILSTCISFYILKRYFNICFIRPKLNDLKYLFIESIPFFFSRFINIVTEKTNTILIGPLLGYQSVAVYDLAMKVLNLLKIPLSLISQVLYPSIAKSKDLKLVKNSVRIVLIVSVFLILFIDIFASPVVNFLGDGQLSEAKYLVYALSLSLPFTGICYVLGASTLVVFGYKKEYNLSVIAGFASYAALIAVFIILHKVSLPVMVIAYVLPEIIIAFYRYAKSRQYNLL